MVLNTSNYKANKQEHSGYTNPFKSNRVLHLH